MLSRLAGFDIELTNMCTLKCPRCARTKFIEQFPKKWTNKNLNLTHLKQFLDIDLKDKTISLCGNYGDPIYHPQLFDIIDYLKAAGATIAIATNGSYKTQEWWQQLASMLDARDVITFGIDGLPENFTQYRINADWASIKIGIDVLATTDINTVWQYIPFAFNENNIDDARKLSKELGFTKFVILPSDRWDENDILQPSNYSGDRTLSIIKWKNELAHNKTTEVDPTCKHSNSQHFISADGFYMPCAYVSDYRFYYKSEFYKNRLQYDISNTTISKILASSQSKDFYNSIEDAKLNYCTFNCPKL
jgi:MoaA/NifB/PqqE/SkfB family radical SAM enzyme